MRSLKLFMLTSVFCMLISSIGCTEEPAATPALQSFDGAWFSVRYPGDFQAQPSLDSATAEGSDSAFFHAPDDRVIFYTFVPQWGGIPSDIALSPKRETLVSKESKFGKNNLVTWRTITANDGTYTRTDQTTESHDHTRVWSVGIQYKTQQDFDDYREKYLEFKQSITRFGD